MAGRNYDAKRRQRQLELNEKRVDEENKIIEVRKSLHNHAHKKFAYTRKITIRSEQEENSIPVEERLQRFAGKYAEQLEKLKTNLEEEELKLLKNPNINDNSEEIVKKIPVRYSPNEKAKNIKGGRSAAV